MLAIIEDLIEELSSFVSQFFESHHLPKCSLNNSVYNKQPTENVLFIKYQLKSYEKQLYDIRLLFNCLPLNNSWVHLEQLALQLLHNDWKFCSISKAFHDEKTHSIDIILSRTVLLDRLLSAGQVKQMTSPKMVLIKEIGFNMEGGNYFFVRRINLVCTIIENLLRLNFKDESSIVNFDNYEKFIANYADTSQADLRMETSVGKRRKTSEHICLIENYLKQLESSFTPCNESFVIIIVLAEREATRVQMAIDSLKKIFINKFIFKLIKVAKVSYPEIHSVKEYQNSIRQEFEIENISQDNMDIVIETMLAFSLLTPKLNSPITRIVHFRNEAIFIQYNIGRIKSMLSKYRQEYESLCEGKSQVNFSLLTNDHEWSLVFVNLLQMHQLNQNLLKQLTDPFTLGCELNCNKMLDQIKKLAHSFSCYYRNVKILAEPFDHLLPVIQTRVKFCNIILNQFCFYFDLFKIDTAERM